MGVFHPFCRVHSSGDENEQEPWSFGEPYTAIAKKFIELRYRLLPYIYTLFEDHTRTGAPMLRSLIYLDDKDAETHNRMEEFALGPDLFTCPISKPGVEGRWLYPPSGLWYDFWTNEELQGGEERWFDVPLDSTPFLVRGGSIVPLSPVRMNSSTPLSHIKLGAYLDAEEGKGMLYEDAGDGFGDSVMKTFELKEKVLTQTRDGDYQPEYSHYELTIRGADWKTVSVDGGEPITLKRGQVIKLPESFEKAAFV